MTIRAPAPRSYWAPELLRGESGPTKAADMFAYAMLMYKLLAKGVAPFGQGMTMQVGGGLWHLSKVALIPGQDF